MSSPFDEATGALATTKTPSTPGNPADGFLAGIDKVLALMGATPASIAAVSHGTTVATNQLLQGKIDRLGLIVTDGFGRCSRSPASRCPRATATPTSG